MNAPEDRMEHAMMVFAGIAANRQRTHDWNLYEKFKRELIEQFPGLHPAEYEAACMRIAKICGV